MKLKPYTLYRFTSVLFLLVLFSACANLIEDDEYGAVANEDVILQNDGYLPLAPDNYWNWETWLAEPNGDGTYDYEGSAQDFEEKILKANPVAINNGNRPNALFYEFSPILLPVIDQVFGNFGQVYKNEANEYRKTEFVSLFVDRGGDDIEESFTLRIKDNIFLGDDLNVGDVLNRHRDSIEIQAGIPLKIVYEYGTYVTGLMNEMPTALTQEPGVDTHLAQFNDIVQTTDSLKIISIGGEINSVDLSLELVLDIPEGSTANLNIETAAAIRGWIFAFGFIPLFATANNLGIRIGEELMVCPARAVVLVNESLDIPLELITNQVPVYRDNYWAKGVGKIKSVTNIQEIQGKLFVELNNPYQLDIDIEPVDPNCTSVPNTLELALRVDAILNEASVEVPLVFGVEKTIIQNLRSYNIRRTLNR